MKILHVDVNYNHSSTGRIVYELSRAAKEQGHSVLATYGRGQKVDDLDAFKFGYDFETVIHAVLTRITGLTAYYSPFSTYRLINKIKRYKPDLVHLHDLHGYFLNIGSLVNYLKKTNIKVIWSFYCEFMYTGKCANTKSCERFETECNNCPLLHDYPKSFVMDFTRFMYLQKKRWFNDFDQLKYIVPTAEWMNQKLKRTFLKSFPTYKIINGIDTSIFKPLVKSQISVLKAFENRIIILSVIGKLDDPNKGYNRLVRIANLTTNEKILFVVIGKTKKSVIDFGNLIHIPKTTNTSMLNEYYNAADYFMILSEYETYPTVCLEASATNTPIIGYAVGGVQEASHSESHLFPFDSNKLVEFINSIQLKVKKEHPFLMEQLDNERMVGQYLNLYQEVMN
jgi:putative colanic acid biosynthesis glycosyltransferase